MLSGDDLYNVERRLGEGAYAEVYQVSKMNAIDMSDLDSTEEMVIKVGYCAMMGLNFRMKFSSGILILLTITLKKIIILQNIWRRVVDNILINISPSNIVLIILLAASLQ